MMTCFCTGMWAASITSEQARRQALQFMASKGMSGSLSQTETQSARRRSIRLGTTDYYYVFNVGRNEGFVIVSGDDRMPDVLGYSEHGSFNADEIPSNMAAWLQSYEDQIRYIQENDLKVALRLRKTSHPAIADMITTKWNQNKPYNDECPEKNGQKCITGCMATAMAQIMYYHGAPSGTTAAIPAYNTETLGIACESLPATTFDWSSMTDVADTGSAAAIAKLMKYCAYSLQADFTSDGTNASDGMVVTALQSYYGYGNGVQVVRRDVYSADNWDELIYNELAEGRPVLYTGQSSSGGGHAFVVHGYDGNGYYSVNWGWGGYQDGQFFLNAMTPASGGIGGNDTNGSGYNLSQSAIVGISTSDVEIYQVTDDVVALTTDKMELGEGSNEYTLDEDGQYDVNVSLIFTNRLSNQYEFDIDFAVYKDNGAKGYLWNEMMTVNGTLPSFYYVPIEGLLLPDASNEGLFNEPGVWKLVPVSRKKGSTEWHENFGSDTYYLTAVIDADKKLTLYVGEPGESPEPTPTPDTEVTEAQLKALSDKLTESETQLGTVTTNQEAVRKALDDDLEAVKKWGESLESLMPAIVELKQTLDDDKLLTENQKSTFIARLQEIAYVSDSRQETYDKMIVFISGELDKAKIVGDSLTSIAAAIERLKNSVANIKNKVDYDAAVSQASAIATNLSLAEAMLGIVNVDNANENVKILESVPNDDVVTAFADLETSVKEAIDAAEEALKLEKSIENYNAELADLVKIISKLTERHSEHVGTLAELEAKLEESIILRNSLKQEVQEILKMVDALSANVRTRATEEEIAGYVEQLNTINEAISVVEEQQEKLQMQINEVKGQAETFKSLIDKAILQAQQNKEELGLAKKSSDVDKLTLNLNEIAYLLSLNGYEADGTIVNNLNLMIDNLNTIIGNSNNISKAVVQLYTIVESATGVISPKTEQDILGYYDLQGRPVDDAYKGLVIMKYKDGSTRKVYRR